MVNSENLLRKLLDDRAIRDSLEAKGKSESLFKLNAKKRFNRRVV